MKSIEFPSRRHDYSGLGSWEERLEPELVDLLMLLASQGGYSNCLKNENKNYTVIHLLVVDVAFVLFCIQSACMVPNQDTPNIYHKQMNNGVLSFPSAR